MSNAMELVLEPWHWFVLGIILMLSELILPAFAALLVWYCRHYGGCFIVFSPS
jgi:membrane protein implicated in regulation of membrane protease activity